MTKEIRNHIYQQRLKDLEPISLVKMILRGQLIEVFKYLNRFKNVSQEVSLTMASMIGLEIMENK